MSLCDTPVCACVVLVVSTVVKRRESIVKPFLDFIPVVYFFTTFMLWVLNSPMMLTQLPLVTVSSHVTGITWYSVITVRSSYDKFITTFFVLIAADGVVRPC